MGQDFFKIWIPVILIILIVGGVFAWQYFGAPEGGGRNPPEVLKVAEESVKEETVLKKETEEKSTEEVKREFIEPEVICQDECSSVGIKKCSDNDYQICGDYNSDSCLEWGSEFPCSAEEICKNGNCIFKKNTLLLLIEDILREGLTQELNTYNNDVKREFGFETIVKTFSSSASILEIKSYIEQIYNNHKLNGVLLVGNLPSGRFYNPDIAPGAIWYSEGLPLNDYIYQDIYDACKYSEEYDAFDYTSPNCENEYIPPFWISRLTPNSSSKDSLSLLKDYFKKNHEYRTGQYTYKEKTLVYRPLILQYKLEQKERSITYMKKYLTYFGMYDENSYNLIDIEKENSDQIFLNEVKKPYEYEILFFNGHGNPTWHQKNIIGANVLDASFFLGNFSSCSVGRFTVKDYIIGEYLFEGKSLVAFAASTPIWGADLPNKDQYYLFTLGEPIFETLKAENLLARNAFGDLTLKMRYLQKPSIHKPNDPIISINPTHLSFSNSELVQELKIKNSGEVALKFEYLARFDKSKESMATFFTHTFNCIKEDESELYWSMPANTEITIEIGLIEKKIPEISPGTYKGEILILSNDPVNPYISVPFDIVINL